MMGSGRDVSDRLDVLTDKTCAVFAILSFIFPKICVVKNPILLQCVLGTLLSALNLNSFELQTRIFFFQ